MAIECDIEEYYADYRERIAVSDGTVRCSETGVLIPAGFPYAICEGNYTDEDSYESEAEYEAKHDSGWETMPQCIEAWRFLRNCRKNTGSCLPFGGVDACVEWFDLWEQEEKLFALKWGAIKKRVHARYGQGKQPRLHPHEVANLESGEFLPELPYLAQQQSKGQEDAN